MSRQDNLFGLSNSGRYFLEKQSCGYRHLNEFTTELVVESIDLQGKVIIKEITIPLLETCLCVQPSGNKIYGMFDNEYDLMLYHNKHTGETYTEWVQASPWSSGPCIFLALRDSDGTVIQESVWTQEEVEANL